MTHRANTMGAKSQNIQNLTNFFRALREWMPPKASLTAVGCLVEVALFEVTNNGDSSLSKTPLPMQTLQANLGSYSSSVSRTIQYLGEGVGLKKGLDLVELYHLDGDLRSKYVRLTVKGRALIKEIAPYFAE